MTESTSALIRDKLVEIGHRLVDLQLSTGLDSGDASYFDRASNVVYSLPGPSDRLPIRSWRDIRREDIATTDSDGVLHTDSNHEPTVELPMHLAIYKARSDINAIVHSHAVDSQIFAAMSKDIPTATIDSYTRVGFGPIRCGEFGVVGTEQLGRNMVYALG